MMDFIFLFVIVPLWVWYSTKDDWKREEWY